MLCYFQVCSIVIIVDCFFFLFFFADYIPLFSSIQFGHSVTPWIAARQNSLSIANSQSLLKLMSIEWMMPSNHLIFCHPHLLLSSIFPSIGVLSNESVLCIRWPKYCSFSFSISPSNEYSGLISFRMDWLDLLAVQGTLKSFLQIFLVSYYKILGVIPHVLCYA